jgi:uncharacterized protein (DUF1499 family)
MCDIMAVAKNEFGCQLSSANITVGPAWSDHQGTIALTLVSWIIGLLALAILAFFLAGPDRVWQTLTGSADMGPLTLETLMRTGKPNDALIGPASALPVPPDATAPVFAIPAEELFATLISRINSSETITWAEQDSANFYARALTFSPLMRFPDTSQIWVLPVDDTHATLVLYAAAKLGHSDMGKNRERLESWLSLLSDLPHQNN